QSSDQSSAQSSAPASGRVRHNEKMTVYLTSEELLAVEQTRLQMRGELGRNIDRGRLVRAALAVALDDWNTNGLDSQVGQLLRNVGTKCRAADHGAPRSVPPADESTMTEEATGFSVSLDVFEGPFDLLLQLISKHQLDVTEVALARVTDEFVAYIAELDQDLEETTQFLLVASTLLDLKAARLLPQGDIEDDDDLALLEARDLLFARLLQYRAFKQIAAQLSERWSAQARRFVRTAGPDPKYRNLLPPVDIGIGPDELALLAAQALTPRPEPV